VLGLCGLVRAQFTEVPTTTQPGEWVVEMDVLSVTDDRHTLARDGVRQRSLLAGSTFVTTGVAKNVDTQVGFDAHREERASFSGEEKRARSSGTGSVYARAKWTVFGDEAKGPALAVLPYVSIATTRDFTGERRAEYGLIVPFGCVIDRATHVNAMISADWFRDGGGGRDLSLSGSVALVRKISGRWGAYIESGVTVDPAEASEAGGVLGGGVTCECGDTLTLDLAGYAGITRAAPDLNLVLRLCWTL